MTWTSALEDSDLQKIKTAAKAFLDSKLGVSGLEDVTIYQYFTDQLPLAQERKMGKIFGDHMGNNYCIYAENSGDQDGYLAGGNKIAEHMRFLTTIEALADDDEHKYFQENYPVSGNPLEYLQKAVAKVDTHNVIAGQRFGWLAELESVMSCAITAAEENSADPRPDEITRMKDVGLPIIKSLQNIYERTVQPLIGSREKQ